MRENWTQTRFTHPFSVTDIYFLWLLFYSKPLIPIKWRQTEAVSVLPGFVCHMGGALGTDRDIQTGLEGRGDTSYGL